MTDLTKKQWQTALAPFAVTLAGMEELINNMSGEELLELHEAVKYPTRTNCWCFTYQAAAYIADIVDGEVKRRNLVKTGQADA